MKFKYRSLMKAMELLKYKISDSGPDAEITMREEDPGAGKLGDCLVLAVTIVKKAGQYDDAQTPTTHEYTLEVFAEHENRPPRLTVVTTQDLEFKP
jgi:hypothetical protein